MFAIISNRRRGVRWWVKLAWTLVLIILAVGVVVLIDRKTKPVSYSSAVSSGQSSTDQAANTETNAQSTENQSNTAVAEQQPAAAQPENTEKKEEASSAPAPADYEGTDVHYSSITIKVPKQWFFSYSQESVGQLLNFGTQNFGPENPYQANMADDLSGYLGPVEAIPSESVGGLTTTATLKAKNGQEIIKKVYAGQTPDSIELSQVVYTFSVGDKNFGVLSYTQSKNQAQLDRLDQMVQMLSY